MATTLDNVYREVMWRTALTTNDFPYIYTSGGSYGFLQTFHDIYVRLVRQLVRTGGDFFMEKSTFNLVANQQEYLFPSDLLELRKVELSYQTGIWSTLNWRDIVSLTNSTEAYTLSAASQYYPIGDILENSFFIYPEPTAAVTNGGKMWYIKMPAEGMYISALSAASATFTFPAEFEFLIPLGISVELWGKYGRRAEKADEIARYEEEVKKMQKEVKPRVTGGQARMMDIREIQ